MNKIVGVFKGGLFLIVIFSFLYCNTNSPSNCNPFKIQLLLEDLMKKEKYFPVYKIWTVNFDPKIDTPPDSSMYFGYLISRNLKIPDKEFYLHWDKELEPTYPDSVKLKVIKDYSEMDAYAFAVNISVLEVNVDSTKMKVGLNYGFGRKVYDSGIFTYLFDEKNCKWVVLDSTKTFSDY